MATLPELLSLEDQCLLHLVRHLERFPPDLLASLPRHLRHKLVRNLPAADVLQLPNLTAGIGVDVTGSVRQRQDRYYPSNHFDTCFESLFAGKFRESRDLVFSQPPGKLCIGNSGNIPNASVPQRHVRHFAEECQSSYLMYFLVDECKCMPSRLSMECYDSAHLVLPQLDDNSQLLSRCLSQIRALIFTFWEPGARNVADAVGVPRRLLQLALSMPQADLQELLLGGDVYSICHVVISMEGLLSPITSSEVTSDLSHVPYSALSCMEICVEEELDCSAGKEPELKEVHRHLQSIFLTQTALESLTLTEWDETTFPGDTGTGLNPLYSTLGSLFHRPQFKELKLESISWTWDLLNAVIPDFLACSSEEHRKTLVLEQACFNVSDLPPLAGMLAKATQWSSQVPNKELIIAPYPEIGCEATQRVLKWLITLNFAHFLSSFILVGPIYSDIDEYTDNESARKFPAEFYSELFTLHLRSFSLTNSDIEPNEFLSALTKALLMEKMPALCDINLDNFYDLEKAQGVLLESFFDALFSSPRLPQLTLNLAHSKLSTQIFTLMYRSWKKAVAQSKTAKQLKCLLVEGNEYNDHISELEAIAVSGDFKQ